MIINQTIFIAVKNIVLYSLIGFLSYSLHAQNSENQTTESSINFMIKNFGVNVDGHFEVNSISAKFNSENELIDVNASLEVKSITTGMQSRDKHLLEEDYFNVGKFTEIVFETVDIKKESAQSYILTANLYIKGIKKKISIPIYVEQATNSHLIKSDFEINRKDFDVGKGSLVLGKTVKISVKHVQNMQ